MRNSEDESNADYFKCPLDSLTNVAIRPENWCIARISNLVAPKKNSVPSSL